MNIKIVRVILFGLLYSILVVFSYLLYGTEYRKPLGVLGLVLTFIVIQILDKVVLITLNKQENPPNNVN